MPAPFKCSQCGFETRVKDELAGRKIKCPKCQAPGAVGGAGAGGVPKSKKAAASEDAEDSLLNLRLDAYQDVEVPEGEVLDESQKPKAKKTKKKKKGASLDPQVKAAAAGFSLLSLLVITGLIYFGGPEAKAAWDDYNSKSEKVEKSQPAEGAPQ